MRAIIPFVALGLLAACATQVPDSGAGVGFGDPSGLRAERDAQLEGRTVDGVPIASPTAISSESLDGQPGAPMSAMAQPVPTGENADIAAETAAALAAAGQNPGVMPAQASPANPAPTAISNPGISDENDFRAVSQRETIQSDAERLERNREQYQVIQPTAVPSRPTSADPNIVNYALGTSNPKGNRIYSRSGLNLVARAQRACSKYPSPDQAQIDFLEKGGPDRDRLGLDPDGDGYACAWDPGAVPAGGELSLPARYPSPSHGERRGGLRPELIVLHYTAMVSAEAALERLCDPAAEVSAHYLIGRDGSVCAMVEEDRRAWHAGAGEWQGRPDVNSRSIGIELDNRGDHPFSEPQMAALEALLAGIMARWAIRPSGVIGHSDMAPGRKIDPGPRFDWLRLERLGLAARPRADGAAPDQGEAAFRDLAASAGYARDVPLDALLQAVRLRLRPQGTGPLASADFDALLAG